MHRAGGQPVVGEVEGALGGCERAAGHGVQRVGDPGVHPRDPGRRRSGDHGIPGQGVLEDQPAVGALVHDADVLRRLEPVGDLVGPPPAHVGQQQRRVLAPQRRRHEEHLPGGVGQVRQAPGDDRLHRLGHLTAPAVRRRREAGELDQEERVAPGAGAPVVDPVGVGVAPGHRGDQGAGVVLPEAAELDRAGAVPGQGHTEVGQRAGRLRAGPAGREQGDPVAGAQGGHEVGQGPQRAGVGPVQVLHDEQHRLVAGPVAHRTGEGVLHREGALRPDVGAVGGPVQLGGTVDAQAVEQGVPGPQRWGTVVLRAAPDRRDETRGRGGAEGVVDEARLAGARVAHDEHRPGGTHRRGPEHLGHHRALGLTAHRCPAGCGSTRRCRGPAGCRVRARRSVTAHGRGRGRRRRRGGGSGTDRRHLRAQPRAEGG